MKTIIFILSLLPVILIAQSTSVSGVLTDNSGLPLPGVNIIVKGTTHGTQSDFDGNYSINCSVGQTLVYSYVGFDSYEVQVTDELLLQEAKKNAPKSEVTPITSSAFKKAIQIKKIFKQKIPLSANRYMPFNPT